MTFIKTVTAGIALVASSFAISNRLMAGTSIAPVITYTASGTFASTPTTGADTLKLAGQPFSVTISVSASTPPFKNGPNWAAYHQLRLTGSVHSGLLGPTPVQIGSAQASIIQAINPGQYDMFTMEAPVKVVGINLVIKAPIVLPIGTISNQLLHPFTAVPLVPSNATVSYSEGTTSTTLGVSSGTLTATVPGAAGKTASVVQLHTSGAQAIMLQGDGTETARSIADVDVDRRPLTETVALKSYASGVSNASAVHARIAGEEVPLVYTGTIGISRVG